VGIRAVTRSISSLERRLRVKLMERATRRISLPLAGQAYLKCFRNVLGMIESAGSEICDHSV
jgi:DNA-binding transcriptional LysR family regulator